MPILVVSRSPGKMQMSIAWKLIAPGYHHFTRKNTFISNILYCFLLPVRRPSRTYLTLGIMLEPYALDVVAPGGQTTFAGDIIFF